MPHSSGVLSQTAPSLYSMAVAYPRGRQRHRPLLRRSPVRFSACQRDRHVAIKRAHEQAAASVRSAAYAAHWYVTGPGRDLVLPQGGAVWPTSGRRRWQCVEWCSAPSTRTKTSAPFSSFCLPSLSRASLSRRTGTCASTCASAVAWTRKRGAALAAVSRWCASLVSPRFVSFVVLSSLLCDCFLRSLIPCINHS